MESSYDYLFKLIIIGDSGTGKSAVLTRYCDDMFFEALISTIGVDFKIKTIDMDGKKVKLQVWDTAGQERFRNIVNSYYRGCHGVFMVYNVSDRESFNNLSIWLNEIKKYGPKEFPPVIHVVGNKTDLKRQVSHDEAKSYADSIGAAYSETSAKKSLGVNEAFASVLQDLLVRYNKMKSESKVQLELGNSTPVNSSSCCWIG